MSLSVVIPCLREAENLKKLIPELIDNLNTCGTTFEIIIIDSVEKLDETQEICEKFKEIKHARTPKSDSYGNAIRHGINLVSNEWTLFMDADGSHQPTIIPEMFALTKQYSAILASRYVKGGSTKDDKISIFLSKLLNFICSTILGLKYTDWSGSLKIYKSSSLKKLNLKAGRFAINVEMLFKVTKQDSKLNYIEIPYEFDIRLHGKTKRSIKTYFDFFLTILKLRLNIL